MSDQLSIAPAEERHWPDEAVRRDLDALRSSVPLVHCITNLVVTNFTANVLLALGASPAMVVAVEEVSDFVAVAQGLLVNVGTVTESSGRAMVKAARAAQETETPWVLDPVAVGALKLRTDVVGELLEYRPTIIRGNGSEIQALTGGAGGKGADSTADSSEAIDAGIQVARETGAVVAISGPTDYVTDGSRVVTVTGGHPWMTKVTGTGCSLGAVMAAFLAVSATPLDAAVSASAVYAAVGERAAAGAEGPGSLAVRFLDGLGLLGTASW